MIQRLRDTKDAFFRETGEILRELRVSADEYVAFLTETRGMSPAGKGWILVEGVCVYV